MTESVNDPRYLAFGALIYAGVSVLWMAIAVIFGNLHNAAITGAALFLLIALILSALCTLRRASDSQRPQSAPAQLGKWFGVIFAAEGIGIGVGSGILAGLGLADWITPWVAVVMGLHFLPLARLLKLAYDYALGGAILLLALLSVLLLPVSAWAGVIGTGTAALLWLAGWGRLWTARQILQTSQP